MVPVDQLYCLVCCRPLHRCQAADVGIHLRAAGGLRKVRRRLYAGLLRPELPPLRQPCRCAHPSNVQRDGTGCVLSACWHTGLSHAAAAQKPSEVSTNQSVSINGALRQWSVAMIFQASRKVWTADDEQGTCAALRWVEATLTGPTLPTQGHWTVPLVTTAAAAGSARLPRAATVGCLMYMTRLTLSSDGAHPTFLCKRCDRWCTWALPRLCCC